MAAQFGTRTVPAPDTSVRTIDLGVGEWVMIKLALGIQSAAFPLGWNDITVSVQHSLAGGPATGNITQLSTEGIEMGFCQGTTYSPTHSSFYGMGMMATGNWTGNTGGGATNIYFTKNPWNTFTRSGGTNTFGGNSSPMYIARDETGSNYPNLAAWEFRHYATNHWILTNWPIYGVEAWVPKATRRMMTFNGYWAPRDHVNLYFNTELGIGARASNPSGANIYPTDAAVANLDTIWFRNFMTTGHTWRIMLPMVHRAFNVVG